MRHFEHHLPLLAGQVGLQLLQLGEHLLGFALCLNDLAVDLVPLFLQPLQVGDVGEKTLVILLF